MLNPKAHKLIPLLTSLLLVAALLSGCGSNMVLGKVYDSFGSQSAKRFKSYAAFDKTQKQQIDSLANSFHSWHRTSQLTQYADFLRQMVSELNSADSLSYSVADGWWQASQTLADELRACNPYNASADLLAGLTDKQVTQIAKRLRDNLNEREDKYRSETPEKRIQRRVKEITKWSSRAGVKFNDQQKKLLQKTLSEQVSLGAQRFELRRVWLEEYVLLLQKRRQPAFRQAITKHIDAAWQLTESNFPNEWRTNEKLWTGFIKEFFNLQVVEQRQAFNARALSIASVFEKLAEKPVAHPAVCYDN